MAFGLGGGSKASGGGAGGGDGGDDNGDGNCWGVGVGG